MSSVKNTTKSCKKNTYVKQNESISVHYEPDIRELMNKYDPSKNTTSTIMTKFEKTTILGKRATQIAYGADALFDVPPTMHRVVEIAEEELRLKKTPYIVERDLQNGKFEYWKIADMIIMD
jgi:DNA-directed RNA polymerase subunit K/omega